MDRRRFVTGAALLPLAGRVQAQGRTSDRYFDLRHHNGRQVRVRALAPTGPAPGAAWPVILFSHGANSTAARYDAILSVWARAGYMVLAPDHLDSGGPPSSSPTSESLWASRLADLTLPLEQREPFNQLASQAGATIDWSRVCAAGHSFGAAVAQAVAGARMTDPADNLAHSAPHPAVSAVITLSPPGPRPGLVPEDAWSTVTCPAFLVTGDADTLPGFIDDWRIHKAGYDQGSGGQRWLAVGRGVDHYFGGLICRLKAGEETERQRPALDECNDLILAFLNRWAWSDPASIAVLSRKEAASDGSSPVVLTRL